MYIIYEVILSVLPLLYRRHVILTSFAPTEPPPPVTPKVVQVFTSDVGSNAAHDTPLVFFRDSSTFVDRAEYLEFSGSMVYTVSMS